MEIYKYIFPTGKPLKGYYDILHILFFKLLLIP